MVDSSFWDGRGVVAGGEAAVVVGGAMADGAAFCTNAAPASGEAADWDMERATEWDASALDASDDSGKTGFLATEGEAAYDGGGVAAGWPPPGFVAISGPD